MAEAKATFRRNAKEEAHSNVVDPDKLLNLIRCETEKNMLPFGVLSASLNAVGWLGAANPSGTAMRLA